MHKLYTFTTIADHTCKCTTEIAMEGYVTPAKVDTMGHYCKAPLRYTTSNMPKVSPFPLHAVLGKYTYTRVS